MDPGNPDLRSDNKSDARKFVDTEEIKSLDLSKNIKLRLLRTPDGEELLDIRNYFRGLPTKKGIRCKRSFIEDAIRELNC